MTADLTVIQNYPDGVAGLIEEVAKERDRSVHFIRPFAGDEVPKTAEDTWALIVLGGPMAAWDDAKHSWIQPEVDLLKACIEADTPTLGICLGGQLLARAAGARNYKGGMPEIGWYQLDLTTEGKHDPLFAGIGPQPRFFFSHHDTFDLPANAELLGSTRLYPNQAFRLGKRVYGLGFHPEKTQAMIETYLTNQKDEISKYAGTIDPARVRRETESLYPKRSAEARKLLANFFERAEL
jgi:GMP synthase (glutamine-hydrolysing)